MYKIAVNKINWAFNDKGIRTFLANFRYPICVALLILTLPYVKRTSMVTAFLVSLFGELIQVWSFASLDKNNSLSVKGLYVLTRNPMYIGRFFLLLGGVLLIGKVLIIPVFLAFYYFYAINRVRREETRLHKLFGAEFESYCAKVNRFVPSFKQFDSKTLFYFNRDLLFKNNAHWNLLGFICVYLFLYFFTIIKAGAQ
jgi:protein-S-isoprenylcysteine O-methyltransferase Ste14